ncbi:hypothetical protein TNCV_16131 [Trichonephila clavipes]|nr:hypothetical protein TNCV_16131 [Trichonephila clavipes]
MTENDAPESTRARIGFLSIITSSWLPVILAVDGGFQYAASPPWKVALFSFPRSTAWRLTGSRRYGDEGSVTTYWGSASRGTWRKTAREEFGRRISSSVPTSSKFRRRFRELSNSLSLSAVAHYMSRTSAVETNRSVVSRSPASSVFLGSGGNF